LTQESVRKKENKKLIIQSKLETQRIENSLKDGSHTAESKEYSQDVKRRLELFKHQAA